MTDMPSPTTELILLQVEGGRTRIQCRFEGEVRGSLDLDGPHALEATA